jgi:MFS family permease
MNKEDGSHWPGIALGVGLSAFAAFLQFKLPPVLPDFLRIFHHDAGIAAGFMSIFALVGLAVSAPLGRFLEGGGLVLGLILGFGLAVAGIGLGLALPQSSLFMLASRGLEGLAFAIFALIGPVIANRAAQARDLPLVTGLIATWIPAGQILGGLLALAGLDWRGLWIANLLLVPILALSAWSLRGRIFHKAPTRASPRKSAAKHSLRLFVASGIFLLWSLQYFAFATWLTQYLRVELALSQQASVAAYLLPAVLVLALNVATGFALGRGMKLLPALIVALFLQLGVWLASPWLGGTIGLVALALYGIGAGITPACLFHLPHVIAGARAGPGAFGILLTGRNIGVFVGPILMAYMFQGMLGWAGSALVIAGIIAIAILMATLLLLRDFREPAGSRPVR